MDPHDPTLDRRLARVIAARRRQLDEQRAHRSHRAERDRIVAEIPRFLARLSGALGDLNDQLSETDITLTLQEPDRLYAAEASYRIGVKDQDTADTRLDITIDRSGRVHALVGEDGHRRSLGETDLSAATTAMMTHWLVAVLETRYLR